MNSEFNHTASSASPSTPCSPSFWQPIKTAPTNGAVFVVYVPHADSEVGGFQFMGYRRTDNSAVACMMCGEQFPQATHWMMQRENPTNANTALKSTMAEQIHSLENAESRRAEKNARIYSNGWTALPTTFCSSSSESLSISLKTNK